MKILVFSQFYYPEPFRVNEICEGLVEQGHDVTVITTFPNYPEGEIYSQYKEREDFIENINGVTVVRYKTIPRHKGMKYLVLSYLSFVFRVCSKLNKIAEKKYDVIYVYQLSPITMVIPAIIYKKKKSVPLFLYCLDLWPESIKEIIRDEKKMLYRIIKHFSARIYQNADMIGITSKSFQQYLVEICEVDREKIFYLPQHAQDIGECPKIEKDGITNLYFMGNIGKTQNIDLIIEAVYKIRDIPNFTINFVGSGSKMKYAMDKVKKMHLNRIILFHGRYPNNDMPKFYRKADACLLTLSNETMAGLTIPGKLQGYMGAGKVVLASIDGDAAEIITESQCGIVVKANDVSAFADGLKKFIINPTDYNMCGKNSRAYYEKNFTIKQHILKLENLLNKVLENRNK